MTEKDDISDKTVGDNLTQSLPEDEIDEDGFVIVKDPNVRKPPTLIQRLRKYFIKNPDLIFEKYEEGDDIMIGDGFVYIGEDDVEDLRPDISIKLSLIEFLAGSIGLINKFSSVISVILFYAFLISAGIIQIYVSQPFDTVKVKLQMFPKLYPNMITCFRHTIQKEGIIRGLYAGSTPAVVASIAENSVLFAAYGQCQRAVANSFSIDDTKELSVLGNCSAGFLSAFFTTLTLCPAELVKCKLQAIQEMKPFLSKDGQATPLSAWKITRDILANEGIFGMYKGLSSTFSREMPGLFCFFGGYEGTREFFTEPGKSKDDIGAARTMCAGAVGGILLWTSTFPADVIKTRIQVHNLQRSMFSVGWEIIRKEGILALYNGLLPSILRTIPASATLFWSYEYCRKILVTALGIPEA